MPPKGPRHCFWFLQQKYGPIFWFPNWDQQTCGILNLKKLIRITSKSHLCNPHGPIFDRVYGNHYNFGYSKRKIRKMWNASTLFCWYLSKVLCKQAPIPVLMYLVNSSCIEGLLYRSFWKISPHGSPPFQPAACQKIKRCLFKRITSSKSLATSFGPQNTWWWALHPSKFLWKKHLNLKTYD